MYGRIDGTDVRVGLTPKVDDGDESASVGARQTFAILRFPYLNTWNEVISNGHV